MSMLDALEDIEIPQPSYRMARPMARLTAGEPSVPKSSSEMSEEEMKEYAEWAKGENEANAAIDKTAKQVTEDIDANPTPDVAAKEKAKAEVKQAQVAYKIKVGDVITEGKTRAQVLEVNEAGRPIHLKTIEEGTPKQEAPEVKVVPPPAPVSEKPTAPKPEQGPKSVFEDATSFDELDRQLRALGAKDLIGSITDARDALHLSHDNLQSPAVQAALHEVAKLGGLRNKVVELLTKESEKPKIGPDATIFSKAQQEEFKKSRDEALRMAGEHDKTQEFKIPEQPPPPPEKPKGPEKPNAPEPEPKRQEQPERPERPEKPEKKEQKEQRKEQAPERRNMSDARYAEKVLEQELARPGSGSFLERLALRAESFFRSQFTEVRLMQQERAQRKLDRAIIKQARWDARRAGSRFLPFRLFYAWRARAWGQSVEKRKGIVKEREAVVRQRQEEHDAVQRELIESYEREFSPQRELTNELSEQYDALVKATAALRKELGETRKKQHQLEAKLKTKAGSMSPEEQETMRVDIRTYSDLAQRQQVQLQQMDRDIAKRLNPLTDLKKNAAKWQSRIDAAARLMQLPGNKKK